MKLDKKILLVSNTSWSIYNFRLSLIRFLQQEGYLVEAVAPFDEYTEKLRQEGVPAKVVIMDNKGSNPIKDLLLFFRLLWFYKFQSPHFIIHYTIKPNIYGSLAAGLLGIKSVAVVTGLGYTFIQKGLTTQLVIFLYRLAFRFSQRVLFLNEYDRTLFCRLKIVSRKKTFVLPGEGVDARKFARSTSQVSAKEQTHFLFIGRILYDKGIKELAEAARLLKAKGVHIKVQVLGFLDALNPTAVNKEEWDSWLNDGVIEYLGAKSDVRPFIEQADCIVLPSYREGISRTLLEAASMSLPIIATDVVGCREIVSNGYNGLLCKVKDHESLAEAMLSFHNLSPEARMVMGENGRQKVLSTFDDAHVFSCYKDIIAASDNVTFIPALRQISRPVKISIITVVLDNMAFIADAIESVLSQSHPDVEYIVIDGGSRDGSLETIRSFGQQIAVVVSEPDEGIYDAMNKGLALATGDVIGFLNADDFYAHKEVLAHVASTFAQTNCEVLYGDLDYVSRSDKGKIVRRWRSGTFMRNKFVSGWMPPHPTFFATREVYSKLGGYNKQLNMAADYELMLRFCYFNQVKVSYLSEVMVKMRLGGQSNRSWRNRIKANLQDRDAWLINGIKPRWYTLIMKPLSKIWQYLR